MAQELTQEIKTFIRETVVETLQDVSYDPDAGLELREDVLQSLRAHTEGTHSDGATLKDMHKKYL